LTHIELQKALNLFSSIIWILFHWLATCVGMV
jgi:hypothetical protein